MINFKASIAGLAILIVALFAGVIATQTQQNIRSKAAESNTIACGEPCGEGGYTKGVGGNIINGVYQVAYPHDYDFKIETSTTSTGFSLPAPDEKYFGGMGTSSQNNYGAAQSFKLNQTGPLIRFSVRLDDIGGITPTGTITWSIRDDNPGLPGTPGNILQSGNFTPVINSVNMITVPNGLNLNKDVTYWLALTSTNTQQNPSYWKWRGGVTPPLACTPGSSCNAGHCQLDTCTNGTCVGGCFPTSTLPPTSSTTLSCGDSCNDDAYPQGSAANIVDGVFTETEATHLDMDFSVQTTTGHTGNAVPEGSTDYGGAGQSSLKSWAGVQSFKLPTNGALTQFAVRLDGTFGIPPTGTLTWAIKADNGSGRPGTILNTGAFWPVLNSVNVVQITGGASLTANTTYWLTLESTNPQPNPSYWTWRRGKSPMGSCGNGFSCSPAAGKCVLNSCLQPGANCGSNQCSLTPTPAPTVPTPTPGTGGGISCQTCQYQLDLFWGPVIHSFASLNTRYSTPINRLLKTSINSSSSLPACGLTPVTPEVVNVPVLPSGCTNPIATGKLSVTKWDLSKVTAPNRYFTGVVKNTTKNCTYEVGIASYKADYKSGKQNPTSQNFFDSRSAILGPGQTATLVAKIPTLSGAAACYKLP